jgi:hypothetical protein
LGRRVGLVSAIASTAVVACTAFGSDAVQLPEAASKEAGPDSAGDTADSGVTPLDEAGCNGTQATFCDDFDRGGAWSPKWTPNRVGSGTIDFDSTNFVSPPDALRIALPSTIPPGSATELQYTTSGTATGITVDLDVFPDTVGDAGSPSVLEIVGNPDSQMPYTARLIARSSDLSIQIFDYVTPPEKAQTVTLLPSGLAPTTWTHVTLTLDLPNDGASTVSASVGAATLDKKLITGMFPPSAIRVSVGLNNVTTSEAWTVLFDNVAITVK